MQLPQARTIATNIVHLLQPYCERIHIGGSIRREQWEVKDIEIICAPLITPRQYDLFNTCSVGTRSIDFINAVTRLGTIDKGQIKDGRYIKIILHEGINLDLFIPEPADYFRIYAIRTGSADFAHKVIAAAWLRAGWCGSDKGFRRQIDCVKTTDGAGKDHWKCTAKNPAIPPAWQSEEDFFTWLNIPYTKPDLREKVIPGYINFLSQ